MDLAVPIVNAELDIKNFFGDTLISTDPTNVLHFRLNREIYSVKLDSILQLPETSIVNSFTFQALVPLTLLPGQTFTLFPPSELEFQIGNDAELKRFDVHSGLLTVNFSNDLTEAMDLIYKIPNATKNGEVLTIAVTIPPGQNSLQKSYDLEGYTLDLTGLNGSKFNTISQAYTLSVNPNSNSLTVTYGKGATAELSYTEIVPQFIEGYFGKENLEIDADSARFDFGKTFSASNFELEDATMDFYLHNEFGAEFSGSLSNINSINTKENKVIPLGSSQISSINLNRATRVGSTVYPSVKPVTFNKTNSQIVPFLSNLPDKISYQGNIKLNPLGNISGHSDFAFYNTGLRIWADIDIPLRYKADEFVLTSEGEISIGNSDQLDKVNGGYFNVMAENGFPFQARIQAYLKDESGIVLDSIFAPGQNTIPAGLTDAQNKVLSSTKSNLKIDIDPSKIEALKKAKRIEIKTYLIMPNNAEWITLYEQYKFKINIVAEFNYKVEI